jgi:hypothetical protein
VSGRSILPPDSALYGTLHQAAVERRCVFFAGLPGVGKSLLLQQLTLVADAAGRRVHLLQWDVARGPFETPQILARYPERHGVTHAVIRKAAGLWARGAVGAWHRDHADPRHLLIGEVPLIGNRLIELAQRQDDGVEALLAGEQTVFVIPVPSREVRQVIEAARQREMARPLHERERANAVPSLVQALWEELASVARELGILRSPTPASTEGPGGSEIPGFDPDVYAGVYQRLLRHRQTARLDVSTALPVQASVYDALGRVQELVPTPDEVDRVMAEVSARPEADVEREVASWFRL